MKSNAQKNRMKFFGGTIAGVIVIFIFAIISFTPTHAYAYAIGSTTGGYDIGASFQKLISPFTTFMSDLNFSSNTTINIHGESPTFPTVNLTPVVENGAQNILSRWGSEFNNWFYGLTGVYLSGIFQPLLSAISWALGLAKSVVDWLLGLFN